MVTQQQEQTKAYVLAGIFTLSLRLIVGWTYFSAFWRRLVLENKLIPDSSGYIGEKFNLLVSNPLLNTWSAPPIYFGRQCLFSL